MDVANLELLCSAGSSPGLWEDAELYVENMEHTGRITIVSGSPGSLSASRGKEGSASASEQSDAERAPSGTQFLVEGGQRQIEALSQFEIGGIVEREPAAFRQTQRS